MRQLFSSIPGQVLDFMVVLIGLIVVFNTKIKSLNTKILKKITIESNKLL